MKENRDSNQRKGSTDCLMILEVGLKGRVQRARIDQVGMDDQKKGD